MSGRGLTRKQKRILDHIAQSLSERGLCPTLREIGRRFGVSVGTVQDQVAALESKGHLRREKGSARGLILAAQAGLPQLPLLGQVPAGSPAEALESAEERFGLDSSLARRADYLLRVKGDSMAPEILEGDLVLVKQAPEAEDGALVIAHVGEDEATVKRLRRKAGRAWLEPANPAYRPITREFKVVGLVVGLVRGYGRGR